MSRIAVTPKSKPKANGRAASRPGRRLDEAVRELSHVFKLLSDETRLRLLYLLADHGELHVGALCERLGQSQPAVSHHLALLRVAGLIEARRAGKFKFYGLCVPAFDALVERMLGALGPAPRTLELGAYTLGRTGR